MRPDIRVLLSGVLVLAAMPLGAQRGDSTSGVQRAVVRGQVVNDVRLFPLAFLSNGDAAKLVTPFVGQGPGAGVFDAGSAVRGITVRAPKDVLDRVDSLLKANDRAPVTMTFRFQLIAAVDSAGRDPAIAGGVDSTLKELFRFGGYKLLAQASATVESGSFQVTMSGMGAPYTISGALLEVRGRLASNPRTGSSSMDVSGVRLNVNLTGPFEQVSASGRGVTSTQFQNLLNTGVSVPIGQTVVLGSGSATGDRRAVIMTVRVEPLTLTKERR